MKGDRLLTHLVFAGFLYTEFTSQADYALVLEYANKLGCVIWDDATLRRFFAKADAHERIKTFVERRKLDM